VRTCGKTADWFSGPNFEGVGFRFRGGSVTRVSIRSNFVFDFQGKKQQFNTTENLEE
jgi:hypothetical protein